MRKAAFYARVSSDLQEKERTIESQIEQLKKQIADKGDIVIKEYIDDGYSGKFLDRPAMNQLREDLRTDLFDTVYFYCADRIARKAEHQTIIVGEILKYNKQLVIENKDYIHNPENHFTLQVLGAVAELEREKILERYSRGRMHKLRQGQPVGSGKNTYGYNYIPKGAQPGRFVINEKEAKVVRYLFKAYGEDGASQSTLLRYLEENNIPTKNGTTWDHTKLTNTLKNTAHMGIKYFNKASLVKEPTDPLRKLKYGKLKFKDKASWLPVKVPPIVSKELFDKVQKRFEENKLAYKKPNQTQLLSNLVKCGVCGWSYSPYKRFYRGYKYKDGKAKKRYGVYEKVAYTCSKRIKQKVHSKSAKIVRCTNSETVAHRLEDCIFDLIREILTDSTKLKEHLVGLKNKASKSSAKLKLENELKELDAKLSDLTKSEKALLEKYAQGKITRDEYATKSRSYDKGITDIKTKRSELMKQLPALHEDDVIEINIKRYCESVRTGLEKATDFDSKRDFFQKHIKQVTFTNGDVIVAGFVPIQLKAYENNDEPSELSKIEFKLQGKVRLGMKKG